MCHLCTYRSLRSKKSLKWRTAAKWTKTGGSESSKDQPAQIPDTDTKRAGSENTKGEKGNTPLNTVNRRAQTPVVIKHNRVQTQYKYSSDKVQVQYK